MSAQIWPLAPASRRGRRTSKPFHWLIEFYGIINGGGFDIVVGNPPYVEYSNVRDDYQVAGYDTLSCGNLYAYFIERSFTLGSLACRHGQIIPTSSISTDRMRPLGGLLKGKTRYISTYGFRPGSCSRDRLPRAFTSASYSIAFLVAMNCGRLVTSNGQRRSENISCR